MRYHREMMMELCRRPVQVWIWLALGLVLACAGPAQAETPPQMTRELIESIIACATADGAQPSGCDVEKIEGHLALAQLARWLMGPHWQDLGQQKQNDFAALLARLLRDVAYPRAAEFLSSNQIVYGQNHVDGKEAIVETSLVNAEEGQVVIKYRLHLIDDRWKVWDVYLDGVSMAGNLRKQVQSIMARKSYGELVERMQKKLNWDDPQ